MTDQFTLTWVIDPRLLIQGWMQNPDKYPVWGGHKGYDFQLTYEAILSFLDGVVLSTGFEKSWGKFIWVMALDKVHKAIFAHLSEIKVKKGQQIKVGDVLGISGATGSTWRADGSKEPFPHLHFGLQELVRGVWSWVDPGPHFAARPPSGGAVVPDVYESEALKVGDKVRLLEVMNLRSAPVLGSNIIAVFPAGEIVTIGESTTAGNITWRKVTIDSGWMAERVGNTVLLERIK